MIEDVIQCKGIIKGRKNQDGKCPSSRSKQHVQKMNFIHLLVSLVIPDLTQICPQANLVLSLHSPSFPNCHIWIGGHTNMLAN